MSRKKIGRPLCGGKTPHKNHKTCQKIWQQKRIQSTLHDLGPCALCVACPQSSTSKTSCFSVCNSSIRSGRGVFPSMAAAGVPWLAQLPSMNFVWLDLSGRYRWSLYYHPKQGTIKGEKKSLKISIYLHQVWSLKILVPFNDPWISNWKKNFPTCKVCHYQENYL